MVGCMRIPVPLEKGLNCYWLGLLTPNASLRYQILRMEFKQFIHTFILIPCLVIKTGRRIVHRLLGYNAQMKDFLRTFEYLRLQPLTG